MFNVPEGGYCNMYVDLWPTLHKFFLLPMPKIRYMIHLDYEMCDSTLLCFVRIIDHI